jgi:hypothetical protein
MKNNFVRLFFVLIIVNLSVDTLKAQPTSSFLSGKVLDENNLPISGVNVQITYVPWNKTRSAITNKKGIFCVPNLPPGGPYIIKFLCNGYEGQTREILSLDLGNTNDLSLHMRRENQESQKNELIGRLLEINENTTWLL